MKTKEISRRFLLLGLFTLCGLGAFPSPKGIGGQPVAPGADKSIVVRISEQHLFAYQGSRRVFDFPVSTGRNDNTAVGRFKILDKHPTATNALWGYRMPLWMGVYWVGSDLENGFHASPVLADGSELWTEQIGTPASDGCIVLRAADMQRLYDWAEVGMPVVIVE